MATANRHLAVIAGARPNFIKIASLLRGAKNYPEFSLTLIHTGQHFDKNMSAVFFQEMAIPKPQINLAIQGQFHTEKIGKMFKALIQLFDKKKFSAVIVVGDVNSTLAGGIAAAKNGLPLIHIEAGLRSHDRRQPEEINRAVVDHLSDFLLTPTPQANKNLEKEGIRSPKIRLVGNLMIETLETFWPKIQQSSILDKLRLAPQKYILVTVHRQENTDHPLILQAILSTIQTVNKEYLPVVFPLHPGTEQKINHFKLGKSLNGLQVIDPLGYFDFMQLVANAKGVITDSGGIQEETSHLGVPCCTLRETTERPVTLTFGSNKLFSWQAKNSKKILDHLRRNDFKQKPIPFWDTNVSQRIFEALSSYFSSRS